MDDDVMGRVTAAVERGRAGARRAARSDLEAIWREVEQNGGDAFHRCVIAHFVADLQDDDRAELMWDERALAAVGEVTDERAQQIGRSLQAFLPSLYGSLADDHRRLGDPDRARHFLDRALAESGALGDDQYSEVVRSVLDSVGRALAAGSSERLPDR